MGKTAYMSWEDVLGELQLSEEELQQVVADVKLRAFKDGGTLKFRRSDVVGFKSEKENEATMLVQEGISLESLQAMAESSLQSADQGPMLLEVPPAGDTQEIPAMPAAPTFTDELPDISFEEDQPGTDAFTIESAPDSGEEDEIGTELNFEEVPLGDTQELPASDPKLQDTTDTDLNLAGFDLDEPSADDITDTVIPTIELSLDDEPADDTTDTVIPTIELSADDDLTDDTSDTVIPTIELSLGGEFDLEGTETAFPTIELGDEDSGTGAVTADLTFEEFGETSQETADFGLATDGGGGMDFSATATEDDIPTFAEAPGFDTQQETSALESQVGFIPGQTGAQTSPMMGGAYSVDPGDVYLPVEEFGDAKVSGVMFPFLLLTMGILLVAGAVLYNSISLGDPNFSPPDYLETISEFAKSYVIVFLENNL